jgi:two-component system, sporulation sensor kinase E
MSGELAPTPRSASPNPRIFLYGLLVAFNAFLWMLLLAFRWQISLRAREIEYLGKHLFPVRTQLVPLPVIYAACVFLSLASVMIVIIDRNNIEVRERLRALLGQIVESLEIGILVLNRSGELTLTNESGRRLLPAIPAAASSLHFRELFRDYPKILEIVRSALEKGSYVKEVEYAFDSSDGSRIVHLTTLPFRDTHKRLVGTLLLIDDVHEAVEMERQMRAAERLSALGTLAAALAHEIRNPLEAMDLNLELLERNLDAIDKNRPEGDKRNKYLRVLESEISRLAGIVNNFLSFARPNQSEISAVRLEEIIKQVVDLMENQASARRVKIELDVNGHPLPVDGSTDQLKQAFLNIIINSLDAMPNGGRLAIHIESSKADGPESAGATAVVRIEDTGEGIPPERMGRLFDPFYTTRLHGTGLGLTIARRVVEAHQGHIFVRSEVGKGTTFIVELPAAAKEIEGNRYDQVSCENSRRR